MDVVFFNKKKWVVVIFLFILVIHFFAGKILYAYLMDTDEIITTFTVASEGLVDDLTENFVLLEHQVLDTNKDASYELGTEEVLSNDYTVYTGVDIPKDPFIRLTDLQDKAYLYVEVIGENSVDFQWSVNDKWLQTALTGSNGGTIYVYTNGTDDGIILDKDSGKYLEVYILNGIEGSSNGGIEISDNYTDKELSLKFYGYLAQAKGFNDYIEAFESCF